MGKHRAGPLEHIRETLRGVFLSNKNECTAAPYWMIIDPRQIMGLDNLMEFSSCMTGPFFCREDAELFLMQTRYNFGKRASVWCCSGTYSPKYRAFCRELEIERDAIAKAKGEA